MQHAAESKRRKTKLKERTSGIYVIDGLIIKVFACFVPGPARYAELDDLIDLSFHEVNI